MLRLRGRRALTVVGLGLLAVLAIDRGVTYGARLILNESDFRFSRLYEGTVDSRIAIFGNSRGVHSWYAPYLAEKTCGSAYNFSFNGLTLPAIEALIDDYLTNNPGPEYLLLDLPKLSEPRSDLVLRAYAARSPYLENLLFADRPIDRAVSAVITTRGWYSELFLRALLYLTRSDQSWIIESAEVSEDLIEEWDTWTPNEKQSYISPFISSEEEKLEVLRRIALKTSAAGTTLVLETSPFVPDIANDSLFDTAPLREKIEGAALPDTVYLDLSSAIEDQGKFADRLHMNKGGSIELIDKVVDGNLIAGLSQCP